MTKGVTAEFEAQRGRLFGLAYRLLGSAEDAEDVVQDAYLRWQSADRAAVAVPSAWLAKVVTNLCLNRLASARVQREAYPGPWLPEPVLTGGGALGPMEQAAQRELVSFGLLVLMERLTPAERAVFVLRESFGYGHGEIAQLLELSEANCRQLYRRAKARVTDARPRFAARRDRWQNLVDRFLAAARAGDLDALERMLAADVTAWADGGRVTAARRAVTGRARVARYLGAIARFGGEVETVVAEVNGEPGVLGLSGGALAGVMVPEVAGGQITAFRLVVNPGKLRFAGRQAAALSHLGLLAGS
jgi:RNA polymerase sigma-70 factor (ECF subfamily)